MMWDLPVSVSIDGEEFKIENNCDYRVVLDCMAVYEDANLDVFTQHKTALIIFYKKPYEIKNINEAIRQMLRIIDCQSEEEFVKTQLQKKESYMRLMSWEKDFKFIAPAVSRILGYDIRMPGKYTHWWSFMGAYMEIGECTWSTFISIRKKKMLGSKLEEWEQKTYRENKNDIDLPQSLTDEEKDWLNSDW